MARQVTDRALRYRANATPPPKPKLCGFCGSNQQIQIGHVNGHEEDGEPENLIWTCRSCNQIHANTLRAFGLGRLTKQYNPAAGAANIFQYSMAVDSIQRRDPKTGALMGWGGKSRPMDVGKAVAMIRATPPSDRSRFAREIWRHRKARQNPAHAGTANSPLVWDEKGIVYRDGVGTWWYAPIGTHRWKIAGETTSRQLDTALENGQLHARPSRNPAGLTYAQAMTAARKAGGQIGDTSGFEPWLKKAKLDKRSPQIKSKLEKQFWQGVEEGEQPETSARELAKYKGVQINQTPEGFQVESDPASRFDTLKDAKRFIDADLKRNPRSAVHKTYRAAKESPELRRKLQAIMGPTVMRDLGDIYRKHLETAKQLHRFRRETRRLEVSA